jgi:hypothetical protein
VRGSDWGWTSRVWKGTYLVDLSDSGGHFADVCSHEVEVWGIFVSASSQYMHTVDCVGYVCVGGGGGAGGSRVGKRVSDGVAHRQVGHKVCDVLFVLESVRITCCEYAFLANRRHDDESSARQKRLISLATQNRAMW